LTKCLYYKFFIIHTQPPWICDYLKLFFSYPQEVVNLSIH
jgi:hypothetical protein